MLRFFCFCFILICFSCKKENANRNDTIKTTPKSIVYQDLDTNGNYITTQTFYLFPDSAGIYFDSIGLSFTDPSILFLLPINHFLYNSKKYMIFNSNPIIDSSSVPLIKFDSNNRISNFYDYYNLTTEETADLGSWSNNELAYSGFSTSNIFLSHFASSDVSGSISDFSFNFDIITANNDSMNVVSGKNHDAFYDRQVKYTVLFNKEDNNCNLIQLSGITYLPFGNLNNNTSQVYSYLSKIPLPKLNTKLAKSIYITEVAGGNPLYGGFAAYVKYADFEYEFDSNNRVTQATITPSFDAQYSIYLPLLLPKRILINY